MLLTREQLQERLIALHAASLELVKDISLETLLERIATVACEQADARYAALGVLDDDGNLEKFITVGMTEDEIKKIVHPPRGFGLIRALMDTKEPIRVPVIQEHPHSVGFPENHPPMRSFLGVPIRTGDVQLGQIYLTEKKNAFEFTSDDEMIIQMLATYSATAIQNARFHESSQRLAILEERGRIGMDLHDGIIQSIYGVGLSLESALHSIKEDPKDANDRVKQAIDGLNQTIRDLRSYILDLRPRQMGMDGLLNGIKRLIAEYRANTFAEVSLIELDSDLGELTQPQSLALFHICQEALANAAKHAKAKKVQISLWTTQDRILMEINDDGMGFDVDSMSLTIGHGLANINTRARSSGGEADISSVLNAGTTILVWIPRLQHPPQ
jgi:signal transduction histidine kinase